MLLAEVITKTTGILISMSRSFVMTYGAAECADRY